MLQFDCHYHLVQDTRLQTEVLTMKLRNNHQHSSLQTQFAVTAVMIVKGNTTGRESHQLS